MVMFFAVLVQRIERIPPEDEVGGLNPSRSTTFRSKRFERCLL